MTRKYSSISVETTLASGISSTATTMTVAAGTGSALMGGVTLAAGNVDIFTVALDVDTQNEEVVYITAVSSDTFTIVRARAGTSNISHTGGATVKHVLTSDDLNFYTAGVATPADVNLTFNAQTGTTYTLVAGDLNKLVTLSNAGTITLTVPNGVFTTGQQINIQQIGAGTVQIRNDGTTVLTSTGATSTAPNLRAQFSAATIICTSSNNFTVIGDLA